MEARELIPSTAQWTLGIDLASQANETAVCAIDWSASPAAVVELDHRALSDEVLLELICDERVAKVGIDAPFGWPLAFIDALTSYRDTGMWPASSDQETLFRATERFVREQTQQAPMSVAVTYLAWPAMRCARILTLASQHIGPVDRRGTGLVAEVYPAAALRRWEIISLGISTAEAAYKGSKPGRRDRRAEMMRKLKQRLDGVVEVSEQAVETCIADDDALDAFVSALVARAIQVGQVEVVPPANQEEAYLEGWIQLPMVGSLDELVSRA